MSNLRMNEDRPSPPGGVSVRLRDQIEQLVARLAVVAGASSAIVMPSSKLYAELRMSICAYAARLRADGLAPERMLALVKSALSEKALLSMDKDLARSLVADCVSWSIHAYYDGS
jgi:hypothetical protein